MSDLRIRTTQVTRPRKTADDRWMSAGASRDGALFTMDWLTSLMLEGRCFVASAGSETTPLTAVAYDQDQPELTIAVADGSAIYVYYHEVTFEAYTGTNTEVICWKSDNEIGAGTSTAITDLDALKTGSGIATSAITARVLHTANVTLTNYCEAWRQTQATAEAAGAAQDYFWWPKVGPGILLVGPATFGMQIAATTTQPTFFSKTHFAILPENQFS